MICRVRLRNIDLPAIPSDWKKLVDTIWNPTPQNMSVVIVKPCTVAAINPASVVNARAMYCGMASDSTDPNTHTTEAQLTDR